VGVIAGGRLLQRTYSVVSLDGRGRVIELLIKRLADGQLSPVLWQLGPGARLHVGPARGLFTWPGGDTYEHVFVAAGTGIAPFVAMLDEARRVGAALFRAGYFGPFGVDGFTYRQGETALLQRRSEINARYSMGFGLVAPLRP